MTARRVLAAIVVAAALVGGCGSDDHAERRAKAEQFVDAVHAAGLAPRLTVDTAEALYGEDAPGVCEAFDGQPSTATLNAVLGHLAQRRKVVTDQAVAYGRVVVATYCPDHLDQFEIVVDDVDAIDTSSS